MRNIEISDTKTLKEIYDISFSKPWSTNQFTDLIDSGGQGLIIEEKAFIIVRPAADEAEIITIATAPEHRNKGYACKLLERITEQLKTQGINIIFLEVREDNNQAIKLYQKLGFKQTAIRKNYYKLSNNNRKDALIMRLELDKANHIT